MAVRLGTRQLAQRVNALRKLLEPLTNLKGGPACRQSRGTTRQEFIIAAHSGLTPGGGYTSWRFSTIASDYPALYYEIWLQDRRDAEVWHLQRAYLHIYKINRIRREEPEAEYVLLHCDPTELETSPHGIYKRGPHLHIQVAPDPLRHAHIALNLGHLPAVLIDAQSFTNALRTSVKMLRDEVLEPLR